MHELGLVTSVVGAVRKAASEAGDPAIRAVALRVGAMSGALPDALLGSWPIATHGTPLEHAALEIETVPAAVWCPSCGGPQAIDEFVALECPACRTPTADLVSGREFEIAWVEWEP